MKGRLHQQNHILIVEVPHRRNFHDVLLIYYNLKAASLLPMAGSWVVIRKCTYSVGLLQHRQRKSRQGPWTTTTACTRGLDVPLGMAGQEAATVKVFREFLIGVGLDQASLDKLNIISACPLSPALGFKNFILSSQPFQSFCKRRRAQRLDLLMVCCQRRPLLATSLKLRT